MGLNAVLKSCLRVIFSAIPKNRKKIMFESFSDFCDNSRSYYEYLKENGYNKSSGYKLIWCVDSPERFYNEKKKYGVTFTSFRKARYLFSYLYHAATAGYVFFSHTRPPMTSTKTQTIVCLWHGIPLKRISLASEAAEEFTHLVSSGDFYDSVILDCFKASATCLITTGFPRNDLLFQPEIGEQALAKLLIEPKNRKLLLWMPTFRKCSRLGLTDGEETQTGLPFFSSPTSLVELNEEIAGRDMLLIIKIHPLQDITALDLSKLDSIIFLRNEDLSEKQIQLYHLVARSDALLTDYSSIYFDYLLTNKPIGFLIDDIGEYSQNRGFVIEDPLSIMPGEKVRSPVELYAFFDKLQNNEDEYENQRKEVCHKVHHFKDGNSSKRLTENFFPNR